MLSKAKIFAASYLLILLAFQFPLSEQKLDRNTLKNGRIIIVKCCGKYLCTPTKNTQNRTTNSKILTTLRKGMKPTALDTESQQTFSSTESGFSEMINIDSGETSTEMIDTSTLSKDAASGFTAGMPNVDAGGTNANIIDSTSAFLDQRTSDLGNQSGLNESLGPLQVAQQQSGSSLKDDLSTTSSQYSSSIQPVEQLITTLSPMETLQPPTNPLQSTNTTSMSSKPAANLMPTTAIKPITSTAKPTTVKMGTVCSQDIRVSKNESLFDASGNLINPKSYGFWMTINNELYLWGRRIGTWLENAGMCFDLEMQPVIFNTETTFALFDKMAGKWKYNVNYWMGARGTKGKYSWCAENPLPVKFGWGLNQPENQECVYMNFNRHKKSANFFTETCKSLFFMACKGKPTPSPAPTKPQIEPYDCIKDDSLFVADKGGWSTGVLKNQDKLGAWTSIAGRLFLLSNNLDQKTYKEAISACCAMGLELVNVNQNHFYQNLAPNNNGKFWTAGTDQGSEGIFGFAPDAILIDKSIPWADGQPDNKGGNENCASVTMNGGKATFMDDDCGLKLRYICTAQDARLQLSAGKQMQTECATIFNIDESKINALLNQDVGSFSNDFKCFLKCMGEVSKMYVNGILVENKVLRMIEAMYRGDPTKMKSSIENMDICANLAGSSECDRAAKIEKCGIEKDPNLVDNLIQASSVSAMERNDIILDPKIPWCPETACDVDEFKMINFKNGNVPNKVTVCGKTYLYLQAQVGNKMDFKSAVTICCAYGLKVLNLLSATEFNCFEASAFAKSLGKKSVHTGVSAIISPTGNRFRNCMDGQKPFTEFQKVFIEPGSSQVKVLINGASSRFMLNNTMSEVICEE
ncbi:uncharacterized protein LOC132193810 [Neocloeon triangulifer]|uniref:uncharacterized protein LOC132193810 n=1 Tax=Neocloeon triangulifer TaxID=2078957 RepID=UPI00286F92C0|nr:uncharacterized protein LOC132193810 [Neocloeon triangulifer]